MKNVKVYVNQTAFRLIVQTGVDFSTNSFSEAKLIGYLKENNNINFNWNLNILNSPGEDGLLYVDFDDTIKFTERGDWVLYVKITFNNGKIGYSKPVVYKVYNIGEVDN